MSGKVTVSARAGLPALNRQAADIAQSNLRQVDVRCRKNVGSVFIRVKKQAPCRLVMNVRRNTLSVGSGSLGMAGVMDSVNQRTQLVGQNRLELLLFRLDGQQLYGINVFKVREVLQCPS
jgi:molybdate-binding protein